MKGSGTKVDLDLELQLHPQGERILPDPQVKDAYVAAAAEIAAGPHPAAKGLIDLIFPLARADVTRRFDNPVGAGPVKSDEAKAKDEAAPKEETAPEAKPTPERWIFSL